MITLQDEYRCFKDLHYSVATFRNLVCVQILIITKANKLNLPNDIKCEYRFIN